MSINFSPGEWDLTPQDIATLFLFKQWPYATPTLGYGVPSEESIRQIYAELIADVVADGRAGFMSGRGRFLAVRHSGLDSSVDLYLNVGYVWAHDAMTEDEYEALGEMGVIEGYDDEEDSEDE